MLIDLIPIEYLPNFIVWADWQFYTQWHSLILVFLYMSILNKFMKFYESNFDIILSSILLWLIGCLIVHGYAVG